LPSSAERLTGAENVFSLSDALCAIDCIISILAPFAVEEQAEAEERQSDLDGLTKGQVRVAKAGRVLSSQNETSIRSASDLLQKVLASRPAPVTGSATDPELIEQLDLQASRYEGPTGVVGVLHDACTQAGIASASLWAAVPHYVSLTPSPRAAKALVDRLADLLDADVDTAELDEAAEAYATQVSEAVSSDEETSAYVQDLERRVDELAEEADIPSGDAIAAELTRYLRERDNDQGNDDVARER